MVGAAHVGVVGYLAGYGHTVTFGIHALDIPGVVALLARISGGPSGMRAGQAARDKTRSCADSRTSSTSQCCARSGAKSCANGGARNRAGYRRATRRRSANLFIRKLSAIVIVVAELFKTFAGPREGHHAGTAWYAGAGRK